MYDGQMETVKNDVETSAVAFKGVKGGDPSRHPQKHEVSYKCPSCGDKVKALVAEGKKIPSGPCQRCQDIVNVARSKARAEETRKRINAKAAALASLPTRSDEECAALTEYLSKMPHMKCGSCANNFPVGNPDAEYIGDDPYNKNSVNFVQFMKNPFQLEVHGEVNWEWMCAKCAYDSHMSV